ncbi:hypothetical protein ACWD5Q_17680 [Streptomyces sp. NPDC002513]
MNRYSAARRAAGLAVAAAAIGGLTLTTAGTAAAAYNNDGNLESGEFGLYYNSGQSGCVFDLISGDRDFSDDHFKAGTSGGTCSGKGQTTNDNTASYRNRDTYTWYVWTDAYGGGVKGWLDPGYVGNASDTFKNKISCDSYYDFT